MAFICPFCSQIEDKNKRVELIDLKRTVEHLIVVKMDKGDGETEFHTHGPTENMSVMIELITEAAKEAGLETHIEV
jgi:hypothetical protein